jgi:hypothetical protein
LDRQPVEPCGDGDPVSCLESDILGREGRGPHPVGRGGGGPGAKSAERIPRRRRAPGARARVSNPDGDRAIRRKDRGRDAERSESGCNDDHRECNRDGVSGRRKCTPYSGREACGAEWNETGCAARMGIGRGGLPRQPRERRPSTHARRLTQEVQRAAQ